MQPKTKQVDSFDLKGSTSPAGVFEGWLSKYNIVDRGKDLVEPGSYKKTLENGGNVIPLLWQHQHDVPLGTLHLEDRPEGLWAKGQLLMEIPEAAKAFVLIKAAVVTGLSIGYRTLRETFEGRVRHLKEIQLYEGSLVTIPMLDAARVESVKTQTNFDYGRISRALKSFESDILRELGRK